MRELNPIENYASTLRTQGATCTLPAMVRMVSFLLTTLRLAIMIVGMAQLSTVSAASPIEILAAPYSIAETSAPPLLTGRSAQASAHSIKTPAIARASKAWDTDVDAGVLGGRNSDASRTPQPYRLTAPGHVAGRVFHVSWTPPVRAPPIACSPRQL